jgi:hypothetical protein
VSYDFGASLARLLAGRVVGSIIHYDDVRHKWPDAAYEGTDGARFIQAGHHSGAFGAPVHGADGTDCIRQSKQFQSVRVQLRRREFVKVLAQTTDEFIRWNLWCW